MPDASITIRDLHHVHGDARLEIDEWTVRAGQARGVFSARPAERATLLGLLRGLYPPDRGSVQVAGRDPWHQATSDPRAFGWAGADPLLSPTDVAGALTALARQHPGWNHAFARRAQALLGVEDAWIFGKAAPAQTVRMRLLLAVAGRPRVLCLDNVTAGLDPAEAHTLLRTCFDLVSAAPVATVLMGSDRELLSTWTTDQLELAEPSTARA